MAHSYARILEQLRTTTADPTRIVASGRVLQDLPGLLQVLADTLGAPVVPVTLKRATLRGTALHALEVLAPGAALVETPTADLREPQVAHRSYYLDRAARFEVLYRGTIG